MRRTNLIFNFCSNHECFFRSRFSPLFIMLFVDWCSFLPVFMALCLWLLQMTDSEGSCTNGDSACTTSGVGELAGLSQASLEALGRGIASSLSPLILSSLGSHAPQSLGMLPHHLSSGLSSGLQGQPFHLQGWSPHGLSDQSCNHQSGGLMSGFIPLNNGLSHHGHLGQSLLRTGPTPLQHGGPSISQISHHSTTPGLSGSSASSVTGYASSMASDGSEDWHHLVECDVSD